jgi:hypothetical protein
MSFRYPAGLITASSPVNANYPSGVWTPRQALPYLQNNVWGQDSFFDQTVLLLHGDGTNGAQNNTFLDSSSNNFTITRNGNTTQGTFTPFSLAAGEWSNYFDGTGDYLTVANNTALQMGSGDFTIEFWIYFNSLTNYQTPFDKGYTGSGALLLQTGLNNGRLIVYANGSAVITETGTASTGVWIHYALVRNGTTLTLYRDGVSSGSTTNSTNFNNASTVGIGGPAASGYEVNGHLSNFRIVKGTAVYTSNFTPPTAPLTAITNTSLLTCQSNRFVDNSTNNFAITRNGDVRVTPFSPFQPLLAYSPGVTGGSGYFDGSGDMLETPSISVGTSIFCFECWLYPTVTQGANTGIFVADSTNGLQLSYYDGASPGGLGIAQKGVAWQVFNNTGVKPIVGQWNHVAFVRSGTGTNETSIFLNGSRIANGTVSYNYASSLYELSTTNAAGTVFQGYIAGARLTLGSTPYDATQTTLTIPTAPPTAITNTSLLLNFTNAGIIDNTAKNVLETVGNAQIDTAVVKYGTGAMEFDGSGDYLVIPRNNDLYLGSGNFTAECWVYPTASPNQAFIMGQWSGSTGSTTLSWVLNLSDDANRNLRFLLSTDGSGVLTNTISSSALTLNAWNHVALVRNGSVFTAYLNGTAATGGTYTITAGTALYNATNPITVGATSAGTQAFTGFIDDLRITKGIARYTANFVPPVARFPNQ